MKTFTSWARGALAVLVAASAATGLSAQTTTNEIDTDQAVRLESKAHGYLATLGGWDRAASLLRRAAEFRSPADPAAVEDLLLSARLSFYEGDERRAVRDFESAGKLALDRGDVIVAANAFTDAAWVAGNQGRGNQAQKLLSKAQLLATSPLIQEDERNHLRTRWGGVAGIQ